MVRRLKECKETRVQKRSNKLKDFHVNSQNKKVKLVYIN